MKHFRHILSVLAVCLLHTSYSQVEGGNVTTQSGEEIVRACAGSDELNFSLATTSQASSEYAYVVTDGTGNILAFPPSNSVMIAGAPVGACRVYGISYTGTLASTTGINISALTSDGEFELSSNWVTTYRDTVSAGMVSIAGGETSVRADQGDDALDFDAENTSEINEQKYAYVITTDDGEILGFPPTNAISISGAPAGVCRVYGFAYSGEILDSSVTNVADLTSDGCFDLSSNWITVTRNLISSVSQSHAKARSMFVINENILSVSKAVIDYSIYSSQGLKLIENNTKTENISALSEGVYIIKMNTTDGLLSARFLKQ